MKGYRNYSDAVLLRSRLYDMLKEFGDEMCIDYQSWFIIDKPPTRVGRYRTVICYVLLLAGKRDASVKDIIVQLVKIFGFKSKTNIWNIVWHVKSSPMSYEKEIRLVRYYLMHFLILPKDIDINYYLTYQIKKRG